MKIIKTKHLLKGRINMPCTICKEKGHNKRTCKNVVNENNDNKKKKHKLKKKKTFKRRLEEEKEEETCCICYDNLCENTKNTQLQCGHKYHTGCILKWLNKNNSCPYCRYEVKEIEKREDKIRLPEVTIVAAMETLVRRTTNIDITTLTHSQYVRGIYVMIKDQLESLTYDQYRELLRRTEELDL